MVFLPQVEAAIAALRERDGSTGQQIQTFLEQNYKTKFDKDAEQQLRAILQYGCRRCERRPWKLAKWKVRGQVERNPVQDLVLKIDEFDELMYGNMRKNKKCSEEELDRVVFHYFNTKEPIEYPGGLDDTFQRDDHFHAIIAPFGTKFIIDKYGAGVWAQMMVKVYDVNGSNASWGANFEMIGQLVQGYQEVASMYTAHCDYKPGGNGAKKAEEEFIQHSGDDEKQ